MGAAEGFCAYQVEGYGESGEDSGGYELVSLPKHVNIRRRPQPHDMATRMTEDGMLIRQNCAASHGHLV